MPRKRKDVYAWVRGERYEGYSIKGIYTSYEAAHKAMISFIESDDDWMEWEEEEATEAYCKYTSGCDYMKVFACPVLS